MERTLTIRAIWAGILICALSLCVASGAAAHSTNESYVYFNVTDDALSGRVEVRVKDLARAFSTDTSSSTPLTKEEVEARAPEFFDYFQNRLSLEDGSGRLAIDFKAVNFLETPLGVFVQLDFDVPELPVTPTAVQISYDFLFSDIDPSHRGFALIESNSRTGVKNNESHISLVFKPGDGAKTLHLSGEPLWDVFAAFVIHGVWHIWLGFDHLLFLATLLLTAALVLQTKRWEPSASLNTSLRQTLLVVTAFTRAHTLALGLATFGIIRLPVRWVEAVIALSIALLALGSLAPRFNLSAWKIALVLGLFHGFGFAYVLSPLGPEPTRKIIGLTGFNVGVEIAQVALIIVLFPVLFLLRSTSFYRTVLVKVGSVSAIALAFFWFVERTYDVLGPIRQTVLG